MDTSQLTRFTSGANSCDVRQTVDSQRADTTLRVSKRPNFGTKLKRTSTLNPPHRFCTANTGE